MRDTDAYRGARFTRVDLRGATFRDVDLTGARFTDVTLVGADVSGLIVDLRVNGVEVAPLVEAELDRRHPERLALRGTGPAGLREGWATVEAFWAPTIEQARGLPEEARQQRVDGEWSFVETLRHLVFVTDAWFGRAVLGEAAPYHPLGLPPTFLGELSSAGLHASARPTFDEILAVREGRVAKVRDYLAGVTAEELTERRRDAGDPGAGEETVGQCLHVVMDEEWCHHQYATRDLSVIVGEPT